MIPGRVFFFLAKLAAWAHPNAVAVAVVVVICDHIKRAKLSERMIGQPAWRIYRLHNRQQEPVMCEEISERLKKKERKKELFGGYKDT